MTQRHALLLVGSPKSKGSSSAAIGGYLLRRLEERGLSAETLNLRRLLSQPEGKETLRREVRDASLVLLSFPLYFDSLPAPVIAAMEMLATMGPGAEGKGLLALANNGFPEASQNGTALEICRIFAKEAGFRWLGGLAFGGGGVIDGRELEAAGGPARNLRQGLNLAAESVAAGAEVTGEAVRLVASRAVPRWLYVLFGDVGWLVQGWRNGVLTKLGARPYEPKRERCE